MNWKNQHCLVLGAAGFCGAHLCARLLELGAHVIALDKWLPPDSFLQTSGNISRVHFMQADICDFSGLRLLLERFPVDTIFHLAAQPIVSISNQLPLETAQINILGTYNVLEAARLQKNTPRVVFASSGAYYGLTDVQTAIPETAPALAAGNIYAPTKAAADLAVRCYAKIYGLRAASCRWMNTYGPGDTNFSRIVPKTLKLLSEGKQAEIDLTDGTNVLEMLHVRDMIEAYLRVAEHLDEPNVRGEAFNFGGGAPLTLLHVVTEIARAWNAVSGQNLPVEPLVTGPKVASVKYLDISKAREVLGWAPQIGLGEGLRETAAWFQKN